jgi:hypothetical protein
MARRLRRSSKSKNRVGFGGIPRDTPPFAAGSFIFRHGQSNKNTTENLSTNTWLHKYSSYFRHSGESPSTLLRIMSLSNGWNPGF